MKKYLGFFVAVSALVLLAACTPTTGGTSNSSSSNSSGSSNSSSGSTSSGGSTTSGGTNSTASAVINGTTYTSGPYSYWVDGSTAGTFECLAESTQNSQSTNVWLISSTTPITGNGTYTVDGSTVVVEYVDSNSQAFVITKGSLIITNYPTAVGAYLKGSFSGTGYWVSNSTLATVTCTGGQFSIYR